MVHGITFFLLKLDSLPLAIVILTSTNFDSNSILFATLQSIQPWKTIQNILKDHATTTPYQREAGITYCYHELLSCHTHYNIILVCESVWHLTVCNFTKEDYICSLYGSLYLRDTVLDPKICAVLVMSLVRTTPEWACHFCAFKGVSVSQILQTWLFQAIPHGLFSVEH